MKPINLSIEADEEFTRAKKWYGEIDADLAERFHTIVLSTISQIQSSPKMWPLYDGVYRYVPLQKFPYTIFYAELEESIIIDAIAHQSRKPDYWR